MFSPILQVELLPEELLADPVIRAALVRYGLANPLQHVPYTTVRPKDCFPVPASVSPLQILDLLLTGLLSHKGQDHGANGYCDGCGERRAAAELRLAALPVRKNLLPDDYEVGLVGRFSDKLGRAAVLRDGVNPDGICQVLCRSGHVGREALVGRRCKDEDLLFDRSLQGCSEVTDAGMFLLVAVA